MCIRSSLPSSFPLLAQRPPGFPLVRPPVFPCRWPVPPARFVLLGGLLDSRPALMFHRVAGLEVRRVSRALISVARGLRPLLLAGVFPTKSLSRRCCTASPLPFPSCVCRSSTRQRSRGCPRAPSWGPPNSLRYGADSGSLWPSWLPRAGFRPVVRVDTSQASPPGRWDRTPTLRFPSMESREASPKVALQRFR